MHRRRRFPYFIERLEERWLLSSGPVLASEGAVEVEVLPGQLTSGSYASISNLGNQGGTFSAVGGNITVGSVEDANGYTYQSLEFNGSNSATSSFLTPSDLTGNASRSIEIWVDNPTIDNAEETMVSWSNRGGPDGSNQSFSYGSTYGVGLWGAEYDIQWTQAAPGVANSGAPAANNWHYLVFTYDGANEDVYVDGSLYLQYTTGLDLDTTGGLPINLAAQNTAASGFSPTLNGSLDIAALRISAGALTAADVENNYVAGIPGQPAPSAAPTTSPTLNPITSAGQNKLTWSHDPNATSYDVFRTNSADPTPLEVASNLMSLAYTDNAISAGVTYTYYVESANSYGAGPASNTESNTVNAPTTAPTLYSPLVVSGSATLDWSVDPNALSYNVYRYTAANPTPVEVGSGLPSNYYTDSTLVNGTTYTYYVTSVNAVGTGPESNTKTASPTAPGPAAPVNIVTHGVDSANDGNNDQETVLTPTNVNPTDFGKQFADALDGGDVIAQPLYEQNVDITTGPYAGVHSVVIVATEADGLYALDANTGVVLWHDNFTNITNPTILTPTTGVTTFQQSDIDGNPDVGPQLGILATPAIDPSTGIIYLNANTKEIRSDGKHFVQRLWAIHIENGAPAMAPAVIGDTIAPNGLQEGPPAGPYTYVAGPMVNGTGNNDPTSPQPTYPDTDGWTAAPGGATGYVIAFNAIEQMERTAVSLINGNVYLGFASHGDTGPYYGWVLGYSAATLQLTAAFVTTPTYEPASVVGESQPYNSLGGIWASGAPISTDGTYLYLATGNGAFNGEPSNFNANGFPIDQDYGDSVLKLEVDPNSSPTNQNGNGWGLKVADYFTPSNQLALNDDDLDLGSGGVTLLPNNVLDAAGDPMLVIGGKESRVYLIDRDNMGKYNFNYPLDGSTPNPASYDHVVAEYANDGLDNGNEQLYTSAAYYDGNIYLGVSTSNAIELNVDQLMEGDASPIKTDYSFGYPGDTFDISDDAGSNGVAWVLDPGSGALLAFNPASFGSAPLYSSNDVPGDALGGIIHFHVPTVANGMVYAGSRGGGLSFYGLRESYLVSNPTYFSAPTNLTATYVSSGDVQLAWTSNSSLATEFRIDRAPAGTTNWTTLAYVNNSNDTYQDAIAGSFVYRVVAISGDYSTNPSNSATVAATGWQSLGVGSPSLAGSSSYSNGVYTVTGSGSHIGSTSDQFQFDYQAVTGSASIVASLATPLVATDGTQPFLAQGGVMFRSSGSANASFVEVVYVNGQGIQMVYRNGDGTAAAEITDVSFSGGTLYVRLDRTGSTFTGYYSTTGTNWTLIGSILNPAIGNTAAVGMVANSHNNTKLISIGFSNVAINTAGYLPLPWRSLDIGSPALAGSGSYNNGVYTIAGAGTGVAGASDQFQFDYQSVTGGASIIASLPTPLVAADGTQPSGAQGGVMFRTSFGANVPMVEVVYTNGVGVQMLYRAGFGATVAQVGSNIAVSGPLYVRLDRSGWTWTGYYSSNGTTWTKIGSILDPQIGSSALVGLVASSNDNTALVNVVYNNVSITPIGSTNVSTPNVATALLTSTSEASKSETSSSISVPEANSSTKVTYAAAVIPSQPVATTSTDPNDNKDAKFLQKR